MRIQSIKAKVVTLTIQDVPVAGDPDGKVVAGVFTTIKFLINEGTKAEKEQQVNSVCALSAYPEFQNQIKELVAEVAAEKYKIDINKTNK